MSHTPYRRLYPWMVAACVAAAALSTFRPETTGSTDRVDITADVPYDPSRDDGPTLDVYRPSQANGGAVIFINSGGFMSGHLRQYEKTGDGSYRLLGPGELHLTGEPAPISLLDQFSFVSLLDAGLTVFDVRHVSGLDVRLPAIVDDVHRAVRFIRSNAEDFDIDPEQIGVWGASSGGFLAGHLAFGATDETGTGRLIRAAATYYPAGYDFASDVDRFPDLAANIPALQQPAEVLDSLSLKHLIGPECPPLLIVYGAGDFPFIVEPSDSLYVGLQDAGVECRRHVMPGSGHEFRDADGYRVEQGTEARELVAAWFEDRLAAR